MPSVVQIPALALSGIRWKRRRRKSLALKSISKRKKKTVVSYKNNLNQIISMCNRVLNDWNNQPGQEKNIASCSQQTVQEHHRNYHLVSRRIKLHSKVEIIWMFLFSCKIIKLQVISHVFNQITTNRVFLQIVFVVFKNFKCIFCCCSGQTLL